MSKPLCDMKLLRKGRFHKRPRSVFVVGFTLLEMMVVVSILVVVSGIVLMQLSSGDDNDVILKARRGSTNATLLEVRKAITAYYSNLGKWPERLQDLLIPPGNGTPFLSSQGMRYPDPNAAANPNNTWTQLGFISVYGDTGSPTVNDGWGNPVIIQVPDTDGSQSPYDDVTEMKYVRVVSAGADGKLDTPRLGADVIAPGTLSFPSLNQCGDDIVLYVRVADQRQ